MARSKGKLDLTGQTFGRITVVGECERHITPKGVSIRQWLCRCLCGNERTIGTGDLRSGHRKSCGCVIIEKMIARSTKHGCAPRENRPSEYTIWRGMRARCRGVGGESNKKNYMGRHITVCDRWASFVNFLADMGPRPSKEYSLDRIDNEGNYEPSNCRWATKRQQTRNRRNTRLDEVTAAEIRRLRQNGCGLTEIATITKTNRGLVSNVIYHGSWADADLRD